MPKTEAENLRIREEQRANILKAAQQVLIRKGFAATMADIAAEAGVSQGLAYRYFSGKEAIFLELIQTYMTNDPLGLQDAGVSSGTPSERLYNLISRLLDSSRRFIENFEILIRSFMEAPSAGPSDFVHKALRCEGSGSEEVRAMMGRARAYFEDFHQLLRGIVAEGRKTGEFVDEDPERLTVTLLCALKGLATLAVHQPKEFKKHYPYTAVIMRIVLRDGREGSAAEAAAGQEIPPIGAVK